jgi:hypothetical protein
VHLQSSDDAMARDALRQGQAIVARLTKLSPDNGPWKQDLAEFSSRRGRKEARTVKVTKYFEAIRSRPDRAIIQDEWVFHRIPRARVRPG